MRSHLDERARTFGRLVHLAYVARHDAHFQPSGDPPDGGRAFAQSPKRRHFEFADTIGLSVDTRMEVPAFDAELGSRRLVGLFAKPRQSFKPIYRPRLPCQPYRSMLSIANLAASSKRASSPAGLNGRPDTTDLAQST